MYIQSNIPAMNVLRIYQMNNLLFSKSMERLASGYRINRSADDPAGLAISENMKFQIYGLKQASRNIQDGISMLQTAEGAMDGIHSMLQRLNVLANQSSNGIYSDKDRSMLQKEFSQLVEEIKNIAESSNFNGVHLLNGDGTRDLGSNKLGLILQVGTGSEDIMVLDMPNVLNSLEDIMDLDISTDEGAKEAIDALMSAVDNVSYDRAKLGAYQNRLEHRNNYLLTYAENLTAAHSRIRDTDMAEEMMILTRARILSQVSVMMLAQANALPNQVMRLLG